MTEQRKNEWIKQKDFVCKEVWNRKEFNRPDGSTGSVQKIINEGDKSVVLWDMDDQLGIIKDDMKYSVTGVRIRPNRDGYDEYNTGKFSTIGPISSMDVMAPKQQTLDQPPEPLQNLQLSQILSDLEQIKKKLDDLVEMI